MQKLLFIIILLGILVAGASAQDRKIRGNVSDNNGPIPFATVREAGNDKNGVSCDDRGNFTITLHGGSNQLVITCVGYSEKKVSINGRSQVNIVMEGNATSLGEVVSVGFAKQKKITNTGAVSMISGKELRQSPAASIQNSLVGRLPGLFQQQTSGQPGKDGAAFYIRGVSSYNDPTVTNRPLIIVDDIEYTYDQVSQIDPNEVESVAILKDASTTAIYGIKGANGVLVITTRRGKTGKPHITLRTELGMQKPTVYRKPLPSYEAIPLLVEYYKNSNQDPNIYLPGLTSDEALEHFRKGDQPYQYPNVNWYNEVMKRYALQQRYNVDVSGGTESVKYFISAGYIYQDGLMKSIPKQEDFYNNYYLKRYNFRSNLDVDVNRDLSLRLDLSARFAETNEPNFPDVTSGGAWPFWRRITSGLLTPWIFPVYNPDGTFGGRKSMTLNPVGILKYAGYKRQFDNDLNLNLSATHKLDFITKGLSIKGTVAYTNNFEYRRSLVRGRFPEFEYVTGTDSYTPVFDDLYRLPLLAADGDWNGARNDPQRKLNMQAILNYRNDFGPHTLYGLVLFNQISDISGESAPENFRGYSGRLGYSYKDKYMLEFNAGYNGTDRFKSSNRYGFFPAVSAGWNISEEPFFKDNIRFMNFMKLRGSYGIVGSDRFSSSYQYLYEEVYSQPSQSYNFGETPNTYGVVAPGTLANEDVRWEKERKLDLGLEMHLFNSKVELTAEYFHNFRYDILTTRGSVPSYVGISLPPVNVGKVRNQGYELDLTYRNNIKQFNYFLKGNVSIARNKIIFRDEAANAANPRLATTGRPIGQIYGYVAEGYYRDEEDIAKSPLSVGRNVQPGDLKYKDVNQDGQIDANDIGPIGKPNIPQLTFGLSAGFSYKGLDFSVLFQGATEGSMDASTMLQIGSSNATPSAIHLKRWTPETRDAAEFPRLGGSNYDLSTYWLRPADYLRLKNMEIGYHLPRGVVNRLHVEDIRIYGNGLNLATWFKLKIYDADPESARGTSSTSSGTTAFENYPQQKIFNLGLQVSFK